MNFSLIIITRNRFDVLVKNLKHNLKEFIAEDEVVIVDCSDEDFTEKFKSEFKEEKIHFHRTRVGKQFQRNYATDHASGDIFLFLDDDIQLTGGSINSLRIFFIDHPDIDCVTGALKEKNEPSKGKQIIEKYFSKVFFTACFGKSGFTRSGLPVIPLPSEPFHLAAFIRGGFSAYRNKIFLKYNFDEYFNGYAYLDDTDFSLSIIKQIHSVFLPEFSGIHDHLSTLQKDHSGMREQYIENFFYIFFKYSIGKKPLFLWTTFGILMINLFKSITEWNFSFFTGTLKGIIKVLKKM
jgi:GT2 family glycosyltransferase